MSQKMKQFIFAAIILLFIILTQPIIAIAQWEKVAYDKEFLCERSCNFNLKSAFIENGSYNQWDLTYNRLELTIDPTKWYISGKVLFTFTSLADKLNTITIDLHDSLTVQSITSGSQSLTWTHEDGYVTFNLPKELNKNEIGSFTVSYEGKPTPSGFGSFIQEMHDTIPVIFTLSEPTGAKEWWPCKESLSDKIDSIDVLVETPSQYRSASNGLLISDVVANGKRICHWKHRHPIANYLIFFSSTQYEIYSDWATLEDGKKVEILNYVYPESLEDAKTNTPTTKEFMKFYSQKFIDYPFSDEKYGHAQFGWNGGMEHQTMTSVGVFYPYILAHELAHQWFGDYITCADWHEIWLNEGFATYLEGMVLYESDTTLWKSWKQNKLTSITSLPGGSVYVDDITSVDRLFDGRLSYQKGAYVLHLLRGQIGDDAFFKGMQNYLTDPRSINGFASTDLFRENMEKAADTTLTEFFTDWIWGEGYPVYDFEWSYSDQQIIINVYQQPSVSTGPFFEMKLPVTITINGISTTYWLAHTAQGQQFIIDSPVAPESVVFNKDYWILCQTADFHTPAETVLSPGINVLYNADEKYITTMIPGTIQADYAIYDLQGQKITSGIWKKSNPVIRLDQYNPGVYILTISSQQKRYNTKFNCY